MSTQKLFALKKQTLPFSPPRSPVANGASESPEAPGEDLLCSAAHYAEKPHGRRCIGKGRTSYSFSLKDGCDIVKEQNMKSLLTLSLSLAYPSKCPRSFSSIADQPNPDVVRPVHAAHRGAPGLPAAAPRNRQRPLPSALQRTLQPRPQLRHGHAQVTACGPDATNSISGRRRKREDSRARPDEHRRGDHVIDAAAAYPCAPRASFHAGGRGVIRQKLTVTANNTRNVEHLSHPVHRYSLKNVYINETRPEPQHTWGFLPSSELTDQKCTDFKTSRNNFKLSIFKRNG